MAKRKRPDSGTPEELALHAARDTISNHATRSEKVAWERMYENLQKLVRKLAPIEDKLLSLTTDKSKIIDELIVLRKELAEQCVHPFELLIKHDEVIVCKFCEKRMAIPIDKDNKTSEAGQAEGANSDS